MQFTINAAENTGIEITENRVNEEITILEICVRHDKFMKPKKSWIWFEIPCSKTSGTFSPCVDFDRSVNAGWKAGGVKSRFVSGMPIYCAYSADGINDFSISFSDGCAPVEICPMVNEETGCMGIYLYLFTDVSPAFRDYKAFLRIDRRRIPFYDAVSDASAWQRRFASERVYSISKYACDAVYSTWYGFHRDINANTVLEECKIASKLGIKTLILDDGWYTDAENPQFYYCGDWIPAKEKFSDMRAFADEIHKLGMKIMVWFSVPYLGTKSEMYKEFSDMQIRNEANWNCLDFRFPKVRDYLYDVYTKAAQAWGIDGMKLDFIDSLYIEKGFDKPSPGHDCDSLEEGMEKFLHRLVPALKKINSEFMIEFRQYYIGNNITRFADMIRVNDCPYDALRNRTAILALRMICGDVPIHSDMIRWSKETEIEDAALQIISSLFAVLQISVRKSDLTADSRKMLSFYLNFSQRKRETLLGGKLRVKKPEMNYTEASVERNNERIKIIYTTVLCEIGEFDEEIVINASGETKNTFYGSTADIAYEVYDCMGNVSSNGVLASAHTEVIDIPKCGMIIFRR
mgnify:CR=1 FL=1